MSIFISKAASVILFCLWFPLAMCMLFTYTPAILLIFSPLGLLMDLSNNQRGNMKWFCSKMFFDMATFYLQIPLMEGWLEWSGGDRYDR